MNPIKDAQLKVQEILKIANELLILLQKENVDYEEADQLIFMIDQYSIELEGEVGLAKEIEIGYYKLENS